MIRVLADYHHASLWESLEILFADRFGWELYRPYGMGWFDNGVWQFERNRSDIPPDAVARQYLQEWGQDIDKGDHFERRDSMYPDRVHKLLTVEQAHDLRPDIVISTLTENEVGWHGFAREVGARFGIEVGNRDTWNRYDLIDFALFATTRRIYPVVPWMTLRQEFSLEEYRFEYPPTERDYVGTWVQNLQAGGGEYEWFMALARALPDLRVRYHGHCGPVDDYWGGNVETSKELAAQMRAAGVGLHLKRWSDGYGHVIHNLFAVGKPIVATATYYQDQLAGPLFTEENSFDVQRHTKEQTIEFIRRLTVDDDLHHRMSEASVRRFREIVNFDAEAEAARDLFARVLP